MAEVDTSEDRKGQAITSRNENSVTVSSNSASHDAKTEAKTVGHLAPRRKRRSSSDSLFQNPPAISGSISTGLETIISRALESSLRPYMDRLQQFEENLSRIDDTVRDLQGTVTDLSNKMAVLQSATKHPSQGSSMQSITPSSCASPRQDPSMFNSNASMNTPITSCLLPQGALSNYLLSHRDLVMDQSQEYDQIRNRTFSI